MTPHRHGTERAGAIRILYLLTDESSAGLVAGQLGFLVGQGFDVVAATRLGTPDEPDPGVWDQGVEVEHLPFESGPLQWNDLRALWATVRLIRRLRPRIVNASTPAAGRLGMLAARLCGVPVRVLVVRDFGFETATGRRQRRQRSLDRLACSAATQVVFTSDSLLGVGERSSVIGADGGEVIGAGSGNGIDLARFSPEVLPSRLDARRRLGVSDDAVVVGFVGRFTTEKGIADLMQAAGSLRAMRPDVHLLLVGEFDHRDPVDPDVRAAIDGGAAVTVVAPTDDPVVYRAMDVLAFPSYREGFPEIPLEAQLCGVPVVGYAATGTVDAVRHGTTGVLVPPGDLAALVEALAVLIGQPERRAEFAEAGRAWVGATFDRERLWAAWADRYRRWLRATK